MTSSGNHHWSFPLEASVNSRERISPRGPSTGHGTTRSSHTKHRGCASHFPWVSIKHDCGPCAGMERPREQRWIVCRMLDERGAGHPLGQALWRRNPHAVWGSTSAFSDSIRWSVPFLPRIRPGGPPSVRQYTVTYLSTVQGCSCSAFLFVYFPV